MNSDHEKKCRNCGLCCWFTKELPDGRVVRDRPCPLLMIFPNGKTKCMVYDQRHAVKHCISIDEALEKGTPPATCGYAPEGYESGVEDDEGDK